MENFTPSGVCSKYMEYKITDGVITNLHITRGCEGNNKAICKLVEGQPIEKLVDLLSNIDCNGKGTSCADQLSKALRRHL